MDTATVTVPLNKLKASAKNVRKTGLTERIEELAASIAALGLLQPPVVEPEQDADGNETGYYLVEAGERRRRALCFLAKQKRIKKTEPITCTLKNGGSGTEVSLAENFHQAPMHPADQFEAFRRLAGDEGTGIEDIAARFGVTATVVKQRLKLAAVSPTLVKQYRAGELNLDQLMAFAITDDHAAQERVFAELSWNKGPEMIRKLLTKSHVISRDRRAIFVGAEAYEAAGGVIIRDLFADDYVGYFTDSQLLDQLVMDKLTSAAEEVRREGWKWIEVYLEYPYGYSYSLRRVYPEPAERSEEDEARIAQLRAEIDACTTEGDGTVPDEVALRRDALSEELRSLEEREAYRPEDVTRAGAFVSLDSGGALRIERGFVKPEDEEREEASEGEIPSSDEASSDHQSVTAATQTTVGHNDEDGQRSLPDKLILDLSAHRTAALQESLAARPAVALIAVVHALALRMFYGDRHDTDTCLGIKIETVSLGAAAEGIGESKAARAMASRYDEWQRRLPNESGELWDWLRGQDDTTRQALMAYCAARTVNALQEPWDKHTSRLAHADELARTVALDMAEWWQPTKAGYLARISKARILEAVREGVSAEAAENIAGMKKDAMGEQAAQLLARTQWLPAILRTQAPSVGLETP